MRACRLPIIGLLLLLAACQSPISIDSPSPHSTPPPVIPAAQLRNDRSPDDTIRILSGKMPTPTPFFILRNPGLSAADVDYAAFGTPDGIGTEHFLYTVTNTQGLADAAGDGIYPNWESMMDYPEYLKADNEGLLGESHWTASGRDPLTALCMWSRASEEPGVKSFFIANTLERAGLIDQAVKAYYAVILHYPTSACRGDTGDFVWYVAPASLGSIQRLCRDYDLGYTLENASIEIRNGGDTDLDNDVVIVNPGQFIKTPPESQPKLPHSLTAADVAEIRGTGLVQLVKYTNGHWQMLVEGKPYIIRGVTYGPTEIGLTPSTDHHFAQRWMFTDKNTNGLADTAYDAWVDRNANGQQDADEPAIGDFALLRDMGCNTIRFFIPTTGPVFNPGDMNLEVFRDLYRTYGIRVMAGDFLGAYTVGSGASWENGTDYTNPEQRRRMIELVRSKVEALKDEPWLLGWILGNENNMSTTSNTGLNGTRTNASAHPDAYASLLQEAASLIHTLDPNHPVAVGNLDIGMLDVYAQQATALDIVGINSYRGGKGFADLWAESRRLFDRPVIITEYGCDAYAEGIGPDEAAQAEYLRYAVRDIERNQARGDASGLSIGGFVFEYLDEWWKSNDDSPFQHATHAQWAGPMPDGKTHEEWFGILGQGSGKNSPFERNVRKSYFMFKELWTTNGESQAVTSEP